MAVKVLRSSEGWEFVREVNLMHSIHHPHLITLHGVVLDNPPLMVGGGVGSGKGEGGGKGD